MVACKLGGGGLGPGVKGIRLLLVYVGCLGFVYRVV